MKLHFLFALICTGTLFGCATNTILTYNPDNLPPEKTAKLKQYSSPFLEDNHSALLARVLNEKGDIIIKNADKNEVTLAAGRYAAVIYCVNSNSYAYRKIIFTALPGESYTSFCKAILGEKDLIGLRKLDAIEAYIVNSKDFSLEMTKDMIKE